MNKLRSKKANLAKNSRYLLKVMEEIKFAKKVAKSETTFVKK